MATEIEEQQAKEFLKRAEIRTMKKDLRGLREFDALKERDKIAKLKTIEEQQIESAKKAELERQNAEESQNKQRREDVLLKNAEKEKGAEKDLKRYADEGEKQQIFLLESEKIKLEDQIRALETQREPKLALLKNRLMSEEYVQEAKLKIILESEKKLEDEQKYIEEKEKQSNVPSEKKSLEERRSELEKQREETEKKRWLIEREIEKITSELNAANLDSQKIGEEKNSLYGKIKEVDNSLRAIYSGVISREEEKRRAQGAGEKLRKEEMAKAGAERKEQIQREQWLGEPPIKKSFKTEEKQREDFLKNIEKQAAEESNKNLKT